MKVKFTEQHVLEGMQLDKGWYKLQITKAFSKPGSSDPTTTTHTVVCEVVEGPAKGVEIKVYFNEKNAMGRLTQLVRCFTAGGKVTAGTEFDIPDLEGRMVEGAALWDAKMKWNTIEDWRPVQS